MKVQCNTKNIGKKEKRFKIVKISKLNVSLLKLLILNI